MKNCIVFLFLILPIICFSDEWEAPDTMEFKSQNGLFTLNIYPSIFKYKKGKRSKVVACTGKMLKKNDKDEFKIVWEKKLENEESPYSAAVSNQGYLITFDDWGRVGYGKNVIVLYDNEGNVVKKYKLEDILFEDEITKLERSKTSRWWFLRCEFREEVSEILIQAKSNSGKNFPMIIINLQNGNMKRK